MTTDVGFLFSIVGVNMSLSSLAGLVIAFRRTGVWGAYDVFRLRQIVEWGFANAFIALSAFPLAGFFGAEITGLRMLGLLAFVYLVVNLVVLKYRIDHLGARIAVHYSPWIAALDVALLALSIATAVLGTATAVEWLLLGLVTRPMLAFVLVLATLGREAA